MNKLMRRVHKDCNTESKLKEAIKRSNKSVAETRNDLRWAAIELQDAEAEHNELEECLKTKIKFNKCLKKLRRLNQPKKKKK